MPTSNAALRRPPEKRQFGRRSTLWHAWIVTNGKQRLPCCVRNVSDGGALLELEVPAWLPDKFILVIEERNLTIRCDLRHRGKHGVGIAYEDINDGRVLLEICKGQQTLRPIPVSADPTQLARPKLTPELISEALHRART